MQEIEFEGIPEARKMLGMKLLKRIDEIIQKLEDLGGLKNV